MKKIATDTLTPNGKTVFAVDDGTREITLVNNYGDVICKLRFRTSDYAIYDRYLELRKDFESIIAPLKNVDIKADGTAEIDDGWAAVKQVETNLIDRLNKLFDTKDAGDVFKTRNPFSSINGEFYVSKVLDVLGDAIATAMAEENELSKQRISQYTKDLNK